MKHLHNPVSWLFFTSAVAAVPDNPDQHNAKSLAAPVTLPIKWATSTLYRPGVWMVNISVGTPPQPQTVTFDTDFADIAFHSSSDPYFRAACKTQDPSFCHTYNPNVSTSFYDLGNGTYHYESGLFSIPEQGDYSKDVINLGGVNIKNQTFAYVRASQEPYGNLGLAPPIGEVGPFTNTYPQYPSFLEQLVSQGIYENACWSVWLDPYYPDDPTFATIPDGELTIGGIDTGKFKGELITFPVASKMENSTQAVHYDLSLTSITHGHNKTNASPDPLSCIITMGDGPLMVPDAVYHNLAAAIPHASYNKSISLYEVPCESKKDTNNTFSLTFTSPKTAAHPKGQNFSVDIPVQGVIWPMTAIYGPTSDPNTCTIAAQPTAPGWPCMLGFTMTKFGFWAFDLFNGEISFGRPTEKGEKKARTIRVPKQGVSALDLHY